MCVFEDYIDRRLRNATPEQTKKVLLSNDVSDLGNGTWNCIKI
jgi:hypothetical protein